MDGSIVTEEEITADKGAATFQALERAFFGVCATGGDVSILVIDLFRLNEGLD